MRVLGTFALATLVLGGCIEGELDRRSIIDRWRVLAIQADHPEARPGMDVTFRPLVVTPDGAQALHGQDGVRFEWVACVRPEEPPGLSGLQYDPEDPSEACGAARIRLDLTTAGDGSATLPGSVTALAWPAPGEASAEASEIFGDAIDPAVVARLLETVGLLLTVELTVEEDGEHIMTAYKRITLVDREDLGTNPPPPRVRVGDTWVTGRDVAEPWTCEPEDGTAPVLPPDEEVVLAPDPDDDGWREEYWVLDITGTLTQVRERPYYAFLSTDGTFDQEITRAPIREELWVTPEEPGDYPLWLVVRDGHGGMSACRATVGVE